MPIVGAPRTPDSNTSGGGMSQTPASGGGGGGGSGGGGGGGGGGNSAAGKVMLDGVLDQLFDAGLQFFCSVVQQEEMDHETLISLTAGDLKELIPGNPGMYGAHHRVFAGVWFGVLRVCTCVCALYMDAGGRGGGGGGGGGAGFYFRYVSSAGSSRAIC
jgi:hypothetical protein